MEAGAIAVRRVKKEDLKRIAKATGGQVVVTLADMEGGWLSCLCLVLSWRGLGWGGTATGEPTRPVRPWLMDWPGGDRTNESTRLIIVAGNEAFDPAALGHAEEVVEERVGDGEMIYIKVGLVAPLLHRVDGIWFHTLASVHHPIGRS